MNATYSRVCWDIESGVVLEAECLDYSGPWELCKESGAQKAAREQQQNFNQQLMQIYQKQFAEQESILNTLRPQLEEMAKNPQGFGATEYAALQSKIVNDVGAQYSNVAKSAAREFATTNEAGLPSGVEAQVQSGIAAEAAGQVAGQSTNLAIANEQLKQQQQQFGLGNLQNLRAGLGSERVATGGQSLTGLQNQFNQATTVYDQGGLWKNVLGGVIGAGTSFLTGGLSNILGGGSFLKPAPPQKPV